MTHCTQPPEPISAITEPSPTPPTDPEVAAARRAQANRMWNTLLQQLEAISCGAEQADRDADLAANPHETEEDLPR